MGVSKLPSGEARGHGRRKRVCCDVHTLVLRKNGGRSNAFGATTSRLDWCAFRLPSWCTSVCGCVSACVYCVYCGVLEETFEVCRVTVLSRAPPTKHALIAGPSIAGERACGSHPGRARGDDQGPSNGEEPRYRPRAHRAPAHGFPSAGGQARHQGAMRVASSCWL